MKTYTIKPLKWGWYPEVLSTLKPFKKEDNISEHVSIIEFYSQKFTYTINTLYKEDVVLASCEFYWENITGHYFESCLLFEGKEFGSLEDVFKAVQEDWEKFLLPVLDSTKKGAK